VRGHGSNLLGPQLRFIEHPFILHSHRRPAKAPPQSESNPQPSGVLAEQPGMSVGEGFLKEPLFPIRTPVMERMTLTESIQSVSEAPLFGHSWL
jgi:hypothetical protein